MVIDREKQGELWRQMWREHDIPFHREDVHPDLLAHGDQILAGGPHRILVPLCGKSVDLAWLANQGHEVVGVELVEAAVRDFFREHDLQPEVDSIDGLSVFRHGRLTILCGDLFEIDRSHLSHGQVGTIDRIWDRAALIALPAHLRGDYTRHLRQLCSPGWAMLLSAVEYDTTVASGPPWSVPEEEIRLHYPGATVELVAERNDLEAIPPGMRDQGHTWWKERVYLIRDNRVR